MANLNQKFTEAETLANILKSPEEGGGVDPAGPLGAGADVPAVLDQNPATRQLLEEAIQTRMGNNAAARAIGTPTNTPTDATGGSKGDVTGVVDSSDADATASSLEERLAQLEAETAANFSSTLEGAIPDLEDPNIERAEFLIENARNLNAKALEQEISSIQSSFTNQKEDQRQVTKSRVGTTRNLLAATGSTTFASGKAAITNEIQRGEEALADLTRLEMEAINKAKNAAAANDLALLQENINLIENARVARNDIRQQQFRNFLDLRVEERAETEFERENASSILSSIGTLSSENIRNLDPVALRKLEMAAGLPKGFMEGFINTIEAVQAADTEQAQFERAQEVFDMALDLPEGMSFEMPGGAVITSLQREDKQIFETKDSMGNLTYTTLDPTTGDLLNIVQLPGIGEISSELLRSGSSGSSGSGNSTTKMVGDKAAVAIQLISEYLNENEGSSLQDAVRSVMTIPEIAGDADVYSSVLEWANDLQDLAPNTYTTTDDGQVIVTNTETGEATRIVPQSLVEEAEDGGNTSTRPNLLNAIGAVFQGSFGNLVNSFIEGAQE